MLNVTKDPEKERQHMAAVNAWQTIRIKRIEKINDNIEKFKEVKDI